MASMNEKSNTPSAAATAGRMTGPDVLRCLAMMMIVTLHFLGKGGLLPSLSENEHIGATGVTAWLLESLCIVAVNVYMLISGYFLGDGTKWRLGRLISLYIQLWVYSVGLGLIGALTGLVAAEKVNVHYYLQLLLPVSMEHYWFLTAYVYFYLFLPILGRGLSQLNAKQHRAVLTGLLVFFCFVKSFLPVRLDLDRKGYDVLWYICVYVLAAYIRRETPVIFKKKGTCIALYLIGTLGCFAELMVLHVVYTRFGALGQIVTVSTEYNHIFPLIGALGCFGLFLNINIPERIGRLATRIAPYTLGVYLLHENIAIRTNWQKLFGSECVNGPVQLLLKTLIATVIVFTIGVFVDFVRSLVQKSLHGLLGNLKGYARLAELVASVDRKFTNDK